MMSPHSKAELLRLIEKIPTTTRCVDCFYFAGGFCNKWDDAIPQEVLESGCEAFKFNERSPPF